MTFVKNVSRMIHMALIWKKNILKKLHTHTHTKVPLVLIFTRIYQIFIIFINIFLMQGDFVLERG